MVSAPAPAPTAIEATTIHKLRTHIIPFVFVLFMIAFVDRINIGFAALTMNKELAVTSQQFGLVAGIFFFGYFAFEIPSNLLMHRIGARIWIARILLSWGIVAVLMGFARTASQLYLLRFLLGVAEAGYIPGILLYLTYWFNQRRLAHAIALFCAANPVASVVGAPISGVILDRIHWFGFSSWRWLLILEGVPAVLGGLLTYFLLPERPAKAKFLTTEEKDWLIGELKREEEQKVSKSQISVSQALVHGRVWHLSIAYFFALVGMYAMNFWMPQLVKALNAQRSNATVGLFVMIPYLVASRNDSEFPQLGSKPRTPLPYSDPGNGRRNGAFAPWSHYTTLRFPLCRPLVFRSKWHLLLAWPFLVVAKRVLNRIFRCCGDRSYQFLLDLDIEQPCRRICRCEGERGIPLPEVSVEAGVAVSVHNDPKSRVYGLAPRLYGRSDGLSRSGIHDCRRK